MIKPGVAFLIVTAVFVGLAASRRRLREETVSGRLPLFAALAASLSVVYVAIGRYATDFINPDATTERLTPDLVLTAGFWSGWWEMVSYILRFPQPQTSLSIVVVVVGALGLGLAPRGFPRAILWSLVAGYVAFGVAFASYTATHPYYALPLIPILALATGVVVGVMHRKLAGRLFPQVALGALVAGVVVVGAQKTHATLTGPAPLEQISDYRRIGDRTSHTTRAIVVDDRLSHPIMYWGWIVGQSWELDYNDNLPPWVDPMEKDFLIVVGNHHLAHPGLRAFIASRPVVDETDRYTIFDIRPESTSTG